MADEKIHSNANAAADKKFRSLKMDANPSAQRFINTPFSR
jgi:hypothetical protein